MKKDSEYVYIKLNEMGVSACIPREFDIEQDYYSKGIVRADNLKDGHYYIGKARNCTYCRWDAANRLMWHQRWKFGWRLDSVNYISDDDGFDLFIAIEEISEEEVPEELRVPLTWSVSSTE